MNFQFPSFSRDSMQRLYKKISINIVALKSVKFVFNSFTSLTSVRHVYKPISVFYLWMINKHLVAAHFKRIRMTHINGKLEIVYFWKNFNIYLWKQVIFGSNR